MNEAQIRRVALCLARTPVAFGLSGPLEMFKLMAEEVLKNSKTAGDIEDHWSREYDRLWPEDRHGR